MQYLHGMQDNSSNVLDFAWDARKPKTLDIAWHARIFGRLILAAGAIYFCRCPSSFGFDDAVGIA
jgi:hypothetical protein